MEVRRIGWQGASRARWLRERMEQRLTYWWHGWFTGDDRLLELRLHAISLPPAQVAGLEWHSLSHEGQHLMLGAPLGAAHAFATRALHVPESEANTLTGDVAAACRDDLIASLWGEGPHAPLVCGEPPAPWQLEPRHGGLLFQLQGLSASIWVWANRAWCDAHGPEPAVRAPSPLSDRRSALGKSQLRLSAHIDLGQIALADSLEWSVGEVLLTDIPRRARVELSTNKMHVTSGVLGQTGDNRHITLA
ncbi:FliM/FliN family flagellar motor switch protein [Pseudoxanthomonas sp. PXM03]|uniref:FliM/FliN family flagellar motor switch protein n=1 Tax=Pseudoxanthomonas sp. PXM03 TaxID=2769284 RepID=UPI00177B5EF4|nr:FliM/FliN family flagellar motor switch protein [Pseudoxanthomonas sp. PXM03]MBD9437306.1 FliM/FliN family flagellar motor switch protein [Pseudoxanthomonas sp. PXM03]